MSDAVDPVESMPVQIHNLRRELAEAKEQRDKWSNLWADLSRSCVKDIAKLERGLAEAREQRDMLAEALEKIAEGSSCCACRGSAELAAIALEALAAVKGGTL